MVPRVRNSIEGLNSRNECYEANTTAISSNLLTVYVVRSQAGGGGRGDNSTAEGRHTSNLTQRTTAGNVRNREETARKCGSPRI